MQDTKLTARYVSPGSEHTFSSPLPVAQTSSVEDKTMYLAALRANVMKLQADVNAFLTRRMEEDKASQTDLKRMQDEKTAEEMYGEEDPAGDDES